MPFKLRYLIAVFFILNHVLGPGSPFRLLFRTLKPVLFVQVMPVVTRSVHSAGGKADSLAGRRGRRDASPFPPRSGS